MIDKIHKIGVICQIVILCAINTTIYCLPTSQILWPQPQSIVSTKNATQLLTSPCGFNYTIQSTPVSTYPRQILQLYLTQVFRCTSIKYNNITVIITIKNSSVMVATNQSHERYEIHLNDNNKWTISADYYVGYVRALETFSQLFQLSSPDQPRERQYKVVEIPLVIKDSPDYLWRGIMIDTVTHYLPLQTIYHTIDGMVYNKLNILHWHIIDDDSFPMEVPSRPQLSQFGKLSGTYTPSNILSIINYAKVRGIRVIPQIDTPAHTQSWGRSEKLDEIIVRCDNQSQGQFDPTIDLTYLVVSDVMKYTINQFPDTFIHFGGDQIHRQCYDLKPSIKEWMDKNNIKNYDQLSTYYRKRQKKLFREMSNKTIMYWVNEDVDLPLDNDDVIQWWGVTANLSKLVGRPNKVVLSNYDNTYLDKGWGDQYSGDQFEYITWRKMYGFQPRVKNVNVIGGQACLWSEINNKYTQDQKLWIRSSAFGERLWNVKVLSKEKLDTLVVRLEGQAERMRKRGFKVSAVTVGQCEKKPNQCF